MDTPVIRIHDLCVALPAGSDRALAVDGLSLEIAPGKTLCVVGESGSGKSITASSVMGLLPHGLRVARGAIELQGESLLGAPARRLRALRGKQMGMVFQEPMTALNPVMTCGAQIEELLKEHTDWSSSRRRQEVLSVLERVCLPDPERMVASYPHQLSGGQRQRIVIAMAVILKPALLICDEPTTALDVTTQREILGLIKQLQQEQGSAVLFITHDMGVVAEIADEVLVMNQGRVVEAGDADAVLTHPQHEYTRKLLAAVPSLVPPLPRQVGQSAPVLLKAEGVSKVYSQTGWMGGRRETTALTNAALSVRAGQTVGIVGESGSGKSTFARCLIRLIEPSAGEIWWAGDPVAQLREARLRPLRSRIQVVFQDPNRSLNPRMTVGESIVEGAINFGTSHADAWALAESLMDQVQLPRDALRRYPSQFSGGQRQRLAIARALACRPSVLVADEAVSALDVSVQAQILKLLAEIREQLGLGMLFITHDLRVAAQLCDEVIVMHRGEIVERGATGSLYQAPAHPYTKSLFAAVPGQHGRQLWRGESIQ